MAPTPVYDAERARRYPAFGLYFRRYAPFDTFGGGFEGDKRTGPSTSIKDTSRTYGCVMFNRMEVFYWFCGSSGTHYDSTVWGRISAHSDVRMSMQVRPHPTDIDFTASTAGANPLVPGSPDIDTKVNALIKFQRGEMKLRVQVFGDTFPNLEVFLLCYRSSHTALLIDGRTTGGRNTGPLTRLAGYGAPRYLAQSERTLPLNNEGLLMADHTTFDTTLPD